MMKDLHRDRARRAKEGDPHAFDLTIISAPPGLKGKAPKDYVDSMAEDDAFADQVGKEMGKGEEEMASAEGDYAEEETEAETGPEECVSEALAEHDVDAEEIPALARAIVEALREDGYLAEEG